MLGFGKQKTACRYDKIPEKCYHIKTCMTKRITGNMKYPDFGLF